MNKADQKRIVEEICDSLKESLLEKIDKVPENWDGFELRQWVEDYLKTNYNYRQLPKSRLKDYRNDVIVYNLT